MVHLHEKNYRAHHNSFTQNTDPFKFNLNCCNMTKVLPTQHKTNSQLINQYYFSIWRRFEDKQRRDNSATDLI